MLKANGYPELAGVEASFEADYEKLSRRSLHWRLAYTAGFETMTMGITEWLINDRDRLFRGADPTVSSLVLWHMVEETEHKSVAFDVYQTLCGRYGLRIAGLLYGSMHVGLMSRRAYMAMLKKDGCWSGLSSRLRLWRMVGRFFLKSGSAMLRSLHPRYHPDKSRDPSWIDRWRSSYAAHPGPVVPLLDTSSDGIPPAF
jgi:predicted metal-dependent hydrolase